MAGFIHPYAKRAFHRWAIDKNDELLGDKLVIEANIPLKASSPGYDESKADELINASVEYAKRANVIVEFWSVD